MSRHNAETKTVAELPEVPRGGPPDGAPAVPIVDAADVLRRAEAIGPLLREHADDIETARRLTAPVVAALRSTGVFRTWVPRARGGLELDIASQVEIIETLARADASAAWCAYIGSAAGFFGSYLDDSVRDSLYPHLDTITAGSLPPTGRLVPCAGGYRLSGRWSFGSGVTHADVVVSCAVVDGTDRQRVAVLRRRDVEVHDTWDPVGLVGTGSNDYSVSDVFVPEAQTWVHGEHKRTEPLYSWRGLFTVGHLGVALGVALEACDVAVRILGRRTLPTGIAAPDSPTVRAALAKAQAMTYAARSYSYDTLNDLWDTLVVGDEPSFAQRARYAGCQVFTTASCLSAVQLLADTIGSASMRKGGPLERPLRDLLAMSHHAATHTQMWEIAGGLVFGKTPPVPIF